MFVGDRTTASTSLAGAAAVGRPIIMSLLLDASQRKLPVFRPTFDTFKYISVSTDTRFPTE